MVDFYFRTFLIVNIFYGIQSSSTPYRIYDMAPEGICKTRRIPLLDNILTQSDPIHLNNPERGAIFQQSWNASSFKKFSDCKFYLQAPLRMGLYLTISKAQLRKNSRGYCIDSIVVKKSNDKKYTFCDAMEEDDDELRVYSDSRGWMRVTVNLDTTLALPTLDDTLEVQFIATIKRDCDSLEGYVQCEDDKDDSCISKNFLGDGFVNCPECVDEKGCSRDSEQVQILNPSNVLLSAIISLLATMVLFGGCLWCLYRYRHCIGNCNSNSAGIARNNHTSLTVSADQIQVELQSSANNVLPSAPPADDKDLPPSYESLFPVSTSGSPQP